MYIYIYIYICIYVYIYTYIYSASTRDDEGVGLPQRRASENVKTTFVNQLSILFHKSGLGISRRAAEEHVPP
jgi:hypothetical protein